MIKTTITMIICFHIKNTQHTEFNAMAIKKSCEFRTGIEIINSHEHEKKN
jgi:hypothetical protein